MNRLFKTLLLCGCFLSVYFSAHAQDYRTIWDHINKNERKAAHDILVKKLKDNTITTDEYITYNMLEIFDGREGEIMDFLDRIKKSENPEAYIYALWFSGQVAGDYGYKAPHQLALLNYLINASPGNGTLRASSHYSLGHHYIRTHQFPLIRKENEKMGAICDWQFVGPFNNISGSGFNQNYPPVRIASNDSVFLSAENAPVKWFTPVEKSTEGWIFADHFISECSGNITYAQSFVNSPVEQDVYLCSGFSGNLKVWVNDQLILRVPEERVTEMDAYNSKCHLNAGYNRILVQVGSDDREPTFIIRITDTHYEALTSLTATSTPQPYQVKGGESLGNSLQVFAETWFQTRIEKEPDNLVNYILLNRAYLRNKKVFEARKILEKALAIAPNNTLLKYELSLCYSNTSNRTGLSEVLEYFKEEEKESLIGYILRIEELKKQDKTQEALDLLGERVKAYGEDESTYDERIQLLAKLNMVPKLVEVIKEAHAKYPRNDRFVNYVFNVEKNINKNPKKGVKLLDEYLAKRYDYELNKLLIREYFSLNNVKRPYQILQEQVNTWPFYPSFRLDLLNEYLGQQRYQEAYDLCNYMLKMKPYSGYYYDSKASVEESMNRVQEAIASYQMALTYQPTLYDSRSKQRKLQQKKEIFEMYPHEKIENLIKQTGKNFNTQDYDYYFLQYERDVVLYPEGGREEMFTSAIKVLNERGIDRYKEISLPYNSSIETLVIEDAQLIKPNGRKIKPEINDNAVVWTGLEANDIIYVKYKKKVYLKGKFAREFYDQYIFESFIPVERSRYTLTVPKNKKFNYQVVNGDVKPRVSEFENYQVYTWEKDSAVVIKDEPYMPPAADFATTLHISTMSDWNEIARWYSDVVYSKIANDQDYEVQEVFNKIFEGKKNLSADEKARVIYNYIAKNINYSSVSFRQSGIIPQKASETINTHLGDCKDLSTLFVSLANLCNLKSNLVLVSTRDNGKKDMLLPSFLFNHCIVKYFDEKNVEHYLELTNRDLAFRSLPSNLYEAMSLTIPSKDDQSSKYALTFINTVNKTVDKAKTKTKITIAGNDMNITFASMKHGSLGNNIRSNYRALSKENIDKNMQEEVSKQFNNPVKINNVSFTGLDELLDSIGVTVNFNVSNEVKKIGAQSAFTIPYNDVIISASPFNPEKRNYEFEYWNYENADDYETQIEIVLPSDKAFVEIPKSQKLTFNHISYTISFTKPAPNKLLVTRKAHITRSNIKPADYDAFKAFVSKVVDTEGAYVTFR